MLAACLELAELGRGGRCSHRAAEDGGHRHQPQHGLAGRRLFARPWRIRRGGLLAAPVPGPARGGGRRGGHGRRGHRWGCASHGSVHHRGTASGGGGHPRHHGDRRGPDLLRDHAGSAPVH
ncbi:hypothetical protein QJS66_15250 [Kocuria rhizophila]|nr:hypothetical protein QJS66_15250 [Kocuria rhizophila]